MEKSSSFKLALIQMKVEGGDKKGNLNHAQSLITDAAKEGAQVIVLPEAMDLGWTHPSALEKAENIPHGETSQFLIQMAQYTKTYICSGIIERAKNGKIYNAAILINPKGEIILKHRKIYELDIAFPYYQIGDRLNVAETEWGTFGVMICADATVRNQALSRALGYMGADIIISPASWAVPAEHDDTKEPYGALWRNVYSPVAKDFAIWIAGVSNVGWITAGPWKGWKCIGKSLIINPQGEPALTGPYGVDAETILYQNIQLVKRPAKGTDWEKYWQK